MRLRKDAKVSLLARVPLFERCSSRDLARIASLAREVQYPAAATLMREGERGSEFLVIVEGEVDVRRGARRLATLREGSYVGEISLITGSPRTATVMTATPMRALVIASSDFRRLLRDAPTLQSKILQEVGERLEELASAHAPHRLRVRD